MYCPECGNRPVPMQRTAYPVDKRGRRLRKGQPDMVGPLLYPCGRCGRLWEYDAERHGYYVLVVTEPLEIGIAPKPPVGVQP